MASKNTPRDGYRRVPDRRSPWYKDPKNWIVVAVIAVAVAAAGLKLSYQDRADADIDRAVVATSELSFPRMREIERMFVCPCGNCALPLFECTCDHTRGAVEVKTFVRTKLEAGLSPDEVIEDVDRSYGGRRYSNPITVVTN